MIKYFWTRYLASYPTAILYMLQDTEYKIDQYIAWFNRTDDFRFVMKRRSLKLTQKVKLLRSGLWAMWIMVEVSIVVCIYLAIVTHSSLWGIIGIFIVLLMPFLLGFGIVIPLLIGRELIQRPKEKAIIESAKKVFAANTAVRIGVVGSYGKTTAKEVLATILGAGLDVAATPGNMNTPIGISRFARKLTGKEDVLILELGEEKVGDITKLSDLARPTMGIMTGINEAHLSSFKSLDRTVSTIFELVDYLGKDAVVYKNKENDILKDIVSTKDQYGYNQLGVNGWKISNLHTSLEGTTFVMKKGDKAIKLTTKLIGLHTVGITAAAVSIAETLGLSIKQIEAGAMKIKPFEHRMEPKKIHGAWVIDDTYNGNSDGIKAGLELLKTTQAKRRIYVTPGLVEQGSKTAQVHEAIGQQAAKSADMVVLMQNSVTDYIASGLYSAGFKGELLIIDDPLEFYSNLEHFLAAGDVVLMQNDWTDNYV